jgi:putative membrane protein
MIRRISLITATTLAIAIPVTAQQTTPIQQLPKPQPSDETKALGPAEFVNQAAASNEFEILSAEIALKRSEDTQVRDFAQSMLDDHRRAQGQLVEAAKADSIAMTMELSKEQKQTLAALEQADKSQFDSAYMSAQMKAHDQAIRLLGAHADYGAAGSLKTYAVANYPLMRTHKVRAHSQTAP